MANEGSVSREDHERKQSVRMLYSLRDFEIALSAADFLTEAAEDKLYTHVDLRRFKCYETTAIVAYARPFSEDRNGFPKLSLKMCNVSLSDQERRLHDKILATRNTIMAHSDAEFMRFNSMVGDVSGNQDGTLNVVRVIFDEGLVFHKYFEQLALIYLIRKVSAGLYKKIHGQAQMAPDRFRIRKD